MRTVGPNIGKIEGIQHSDPTGRIHTRTRPDLFPGSGWLWRLTDLWSTAYKPKPPPHHRLFNRLDPIIMPPKQTATIRAAMTRVSRGRGSLRVVEGGEIGGTVTEVRVVVVLIRTVVLILRVNCLVG